jgi:hypothetical protein
MSNSNTGLFLEEARLREIEAQAARLREDLEVGHQGEE